jgi:hypothetical protein
MSATGIESHCLNCQAGLAAAQSYCGDCGQRVLHGRLTMHDIGHDLVHAMTHADHSVFALIKGLAFHPGRVARDYVDGKRKKYFGPFAFLFISVGLASFVILVAGVRWFAPLGDTSAASFLQKHINLIIVMQAPILAGLCRLFFRGKGLSYAENLVLAAYTSGFRCMLLAFVGTPLMYFTGAAGSNRAVLAGYYLVWVLYFAWAAVQFFGGRAGWTACKAAAAAILTQVIAVYVIFAFIWTWSRFAN